MAFTAGKKAMETTRTTIADLEHDLENALDRVRQMETSGQLPPDLKALLLLAPIEGTSVHASLRHRDAGRQIRRTHGAQAFSQADCAVWIVFEPPLAAVSSSGAVHTDVAATSGDRPGTPAFDEFVLALHDAENQPQLTFVSLKWFRDTYLAKRGYRWAKDPDMPRRLLQEATERDMVLTDRVPNPKQPEFPVTSIRLNRDHPDVRRILEGAPGA